MDAFHNEIWEKVVHARGYLAGKTEAKGDPLTLCEMYSDALTYIEEVLADIQLACEHDSFLQK